MTPDGDPRGEAIQLASIPEALEDLKAGKMIVLVDDEDRENEGDLVMFAEHITAEGVNFMARLCALTATFAALRIAEISVRLL